VGLIPATGSAIAMGKVYTAYTNAAYPTAGGTNVRLSATLGASYGGKVAGTQISLSSTFGGRTTPYTYPA
jgi:hypothetical protein